MLKRFNHSPRIVIAGFCVGIMIAIGIYLLLYPTHFSESAAEAHHLGVSPSAYITAKQLWKEHCQLGKPLSDSDFQSAVNLTRYHNSHHNGWSIRVRAVEALAAAAGTHNSAAATTVAQGLMSDPNGIVRQRALGTLWHLNPTQGRQDALKSLHDPNQYVRRIAHLLLDPSH